ncbi:hypothetical protein T492DRAFT_1100285 [Pavlovales sp. CCMP2436]|nr:hypothetical protein T492DRAFT_1100285 [Pavlovales sp. CCMP2436]
MIAAFRVTMGFIVGYQAPQRFFGGETGESYAGLVEVAKKLLASTPEATTERVMGVLRLFPTQPQLLRPHRFWFELMGVFTPLLFPFLVGNCSRESWANEATGEVWTSRVKIEKCRFLEGANCKGMCVALCKGPTELFFNNELGLPLSMMPNFKDGSCTMTWGEPMRGPSDLDDQDLSCYISPVCGIRGDAKHLVAIKAHCPETGLPANLPSVPPLIGPLVNG